MMHPKMKYTYAGLDSHKDSHTVVFLNCFYEKIGELVIPTTPSTFPDFFENAKAYLLEGTDFAFGFEDISSYGRSLVKFLVENGQLVKHVNAALVASERNSRNVLAKTDSIDAESVARVLLNRFDELPVANPNDKLWTLKSVVAHRDSLIKMETMLKNRLQSLIFETYPSYHSFFSDISCYSALAFYEAYPSPSCLLESSVEELTVLLKAASMKHIGEKKALEIWNAVRSDGVKPSEYDSVRNKAVCATVSQLRTCVEGVRAIEDELLYLVDQFDYPLTSMKGIDTVMAAKLIAEIGDIERFRSAGALASYAGVAPVTYASGRSSIQYANERGNRTLNEVFYRIALNFTLLSGPNKVAINPFFYEYYQRKLSEGKTRKQALKCMQRRLVNIVYGIMKHKEDYINPPVSFPERDKLLESKKHQSCFH